MKQRQGFSLIEILVVTGIMGVLLAVGISAYNSLNNQSQVEQAAQLLATQLRSIQKRADAGDSECAVGEKFGGFEVRRIAPDSIGYYSICNSVTAGSADEVIQSVNHTLFDNFVGFTFKSLGRGVAPGSTINVSKNLITYTVTITAAGGISVNKQ